MKKVKKGDVRNGSNRHIPAVPLRGAFYSAASGPADRRRIMPAAQLAPSLKNLAYRLFGGVVPDLAPNQLYWGYYAPPVSRTAGGAIKGTPQGNRRFFLFNPIRAISDVTFLVFFKMILPYIEFITLLGLFSQNKWDYTPLQSPRGDYTPLQSPPGGLHPL